MTSVHPKHDHESCFFFQGLGATFCFVICCCFLLTLFVLFCFCILTELPLGHTHIMAYPVLSYVLEGWPGQRTRGVLSALLFEVNSCLLSHLPSREVFGYECSILYKRWFELLNQCVAKHSPESWNESESQVKGKLILTWFPYDSVTLPVETRMVLELINVSGCCFSCVAGTVIIIPAENLVISGEKTMITM